LRGKSLQILSMAALALLTVNVPARANQAGGFVSTVTTPVTSGTESYNGETCYFLDNGIIHMDIDTRPYVISLKFLKPGLSGTPQANGVQMVGTQGGTTSNYGGNCNISYSDPGNVMLFSGKTMTYATPPTAQQVDMAFPYTYNSSGGSQPWDSTIHWVLRQGDTGVYTYLVISHPASYAAATSPGLTLLWGAAHDSINFTQENVYIDNLGTGQVDNRGLPESRRHGLNVSFEDGNNVEATNGPAEDMEVINPDPASKFYGFIESKYSYIADLWLLNCWGRASDVNQNGAWFVQGSHEFQPSGPEMNDFTQGWGLVYDCLTSLHGIQAGFTIPQGTAYTKTYGPTLLYMNTQSTGAAGWTDAQQQAVAEKAAWPYSWLTYEPSYQTASHRATVTGTLTITDQLNSHASANGAWVGLAEPDTGDLGLSGGEASEQLTNWMQQGDDLQYWVQADSDGSFTIPNVATTDCYGEPEQYALYIYSNGVSGSNGTVGEYMGPVFSPTAGKTTNLGDITWNVPHQGTSIVWQVGNPDRSAQEFGGYQISFQPLNWEYEEDSYGDLYYDGANPSNDFYQYPATIEYNTATDSPSKINYVHASDNSTAWPWDFNFTLSSAPTAGNYWLNIAYAGTGKNNGYCGLESVTVNGTALLFDVFGGRNTGFYPGNNGGDIYNRTHQHGAYSVAHIPIPSSMLKTGSNTITLTPDPATNTPFMYYDYLNLESPSLVDNGVYTLSIEKSGNNLYTLGMYSVTGTDTKVWTYPGSGAALNQWQVINLGGSRNYCEFINVASGMALTGDDGKVDVAPLVNSSSQVWQVEAGTDGGYLLRCQGQSYDAADGGTITQPYTSGANVVVLSGASGGAPGQNWVFTPVTPEVSCASVVSGTVNDSISVWPTTGAYGTDFAPSNDYSSSGFTFVPTNISEGPTFSATGLPPGLTIDSVTGLVSGKPSTSGTYSATIKATNAGGTGSQAVTFDIAN
jgi:hypothetical protein